jgi:AraC-like DNA-binding protein/anti-anti-sigma regulatory factor
MAASAGLTECVKAERAARPARLVIDMSGVSIVDSSGARALAAAVGSVPGQCPVVVRSLRPAARRQLELTGLDLGGLDHEAGSAEARPRGGDGALAQTATGILVREWKHVLGAAEHTIADSHRTALALASTEDHVAATLLRLGARRPAASARLEALSRTARDYAAMLRDRERPDRDPPGRRPYTASGTVGLAVAFINERARDDIGVADIAAASFVTIRAVQLAFRRYLNTTPLGYLRQIRLERAHDQLLSADSDRTTVTAVAADWHFSNASRFSGHYRAAYGVPPIQTLRQRHADD